MGSRSRARRAEPSRPWTDRLNLTWLAVRRTQRHFETKVFPGQPLDAVFSGMSGRRADKHFIDAAVGQLMIWTGYAAIPAAPFALLSTEVPAPWGTALFAAALAIALPPSLTAALLVISGWVLRARLPAEQRNASLYLRHGTDRDLMWTGTKLVAAVAVGAGIVLAAVLT